ncbi:anti-repressor SinI family protein [Bacillus thermotolerans]|uniref:Sin domain-containing protein n=1 Tax=Bacillus thermotolerans TaxID=1221996 RepID=A0A0F5I385_BACTR|nr:anti-repressor SinI family protein [Bacillus thermotolerans]KKB40119.1 hypothetical protein QY95_01858 [Bacillus thermotolerans]
MESQLQEVTDQEWMELMTEALKIGLSKEEVKAFLLEKGKSAT